MKILITGASGFIGSNLIPRTIDCNHEVFILDRVANRSFPKEALFIKADLTDRNEAKKAASRLPRALDTCIHLAGQADVALSLKDPAKDLKANAVSMINLLSIFRFRRFINISTGSVYDGHSGMVDPSDNIFPAIPYGISKYASELYLKYFAKNTGNPSEYLTLRLFNPYGPNENPKRFMPWLIRHFGIEKKRTILIRGTGGAIVDPMYIDDCIDAITKSIYSKTVNTTIDICRGNPMTIVKLAGKVASVFGIRGRVTCSGASCEEISFYGDPRPQLKLLGFRPAISLSNGITRYVAFLKK